MTRILSLAALGVACVSLIVLVLERGAPRTYPLGVLARERFPAPRASDVLLAAAAGSAFVIVPLIVAGFTGGARVTFMVPSSWLAWMILALASAAVAVVGAGIEELMFRGAVLPIFNRRMPLWAAVPTSAFVFALAHLERQGNRAPSLMTLVDFLLDGIGFAIAFLATGTLWVAVALHASKNLAVWLLVGGFFGFMTPLLEVTTNAPGWFGARGQAGTLDVQATGAVVLVLAVLWRRRIRARP